MVVGWHGVLQARLHFYWNCVQSQSWLALSILILLVVVAVAAATVWRQSLYLCNANFWKLVRFHDSDKPFYKCIDYGAQAIDGIRFEYVLFAIAIAIAVTGFYRFAHGLWIIYAYASNVQRMKDTSLSMLCKYFCTLNGSCVFDTEHLCCLLNISVVFAKHYRNHCTYWLHICRFDYGSIQLHIARTYLCSKVHWLPHCKDDAFAKCKRFMTSR